MSLQPSLPTTSPEQPGPIAATSPGLHTAATASPNGSALPTPSRLPSARRGTKGVRWFIPAAALLLIGSVPLIWWVWFRGSAHRTDLATAKIQRRDLQLKIVERGTLEAKDNRFVICEVKTGSRGAPKIKDVMDNGTQVRGPIFASELLFNLIPIMKKPGDVLAVIDDSYLQEQATNQKIARDKAEADKISAELLYPSKKIAIALAEKNLDKWVKGDFPQTLHDLEGQIQTTESNLLQEEDRMAWVARMVKKTYMTASQEEAEKALLMGAKLDLQKKQEQKKVLTDYTDPTTRQTLENAISDAKNAEKTANADMLIKKAIFEQQDGLYKDLLDQVNQCTVRAQSSGIVVYYVPEQTRTGSGANQSVIAQGEPVQYGQKMMSIPDLSHMVVNVRIHEAFIKNVRPGLRVGIRVDAAAEKILKGRVKMVANVAAQQDWMSPDVKVYPAMVEITGVEGVEEQFPGLSPDQLKEKQFDEVQKLKLKPGLSAVCTIMTDVKVENSLAVPTESILPPVGKDGNPRVMIRKPGGETEMREVKLLVVDGKKMSDNVYVAIKEGVTDGEEVVLNPTKSSSGDKDKKSGKDDEKAAPSGKPGRSGGGKGKPDSAD